MANDAKTILHELETRVRQLILQDKELQQKIDAQLAEITNLKQRITSQDQQYQELSDKYAKLKTAKILELGDNDMRNARLQLNRLVRDVDKCIALLKG